MRSFVQKSLAFAIVACCSFSGVTAEQTGSFYVSDIRELLDQQGVLWDCVTRTFDVYPVGTATRVESSDNKVLAGTRMGPYSLYAKPKGAEGPFVYALIIETRALFLSKNGNSTDRSRAVEVKEEITSIKVQPLPANEFYTPLKD